MIQTTSNPLIPPPSAAHIATPPINTNDQQALLSPSERRSFFRLSLASLFNNKLATQRADREIQPPPQSASSTRSFTSLLPRHQDSPVNAHFSPISNVSSPTETVTTTEASSPINFICPDPRGHDAATLLTRRTELRHQRAWVRKREDCDDYCLWDYDEEVAGENGRAGRGRGRPRLYPDRGSNRKHSNEYGYSNAPFMTAFCGPPTVRCKLWQFAIFGIALCGVLGTYLALALTPSTHLPLALHITLIILVIVLAIFVFHALLCALVLLHLQESSPSSRIGNDHHHQRHHSRRDAEGNGRRKKHRHNRRARGDMRGVDHPDISNAPEVTATSGARAQDNANAHVRQAAADPDALPLDDSMYTPNTPVRVHIRRDEEAGISYIEAVPAATGTHREGDEPVERGGGRADVRETVEEMDAVPDPPEYGHWRTSVKADPNLLHWRAAALGNNTNAHAAADAVSSVSGGVEGRRVREESERPPSYVDIPPPGAPPAPGQVDGFAGGESDEGVWPIRAEAMVAEVAEDDLVVRPRSVGAGGADAGEGDVQELTREMLRGSVSGGRGDRLSMV
ncbi:MAG: hypothetical protein M1831_001804 [Alyxoria varia]|nr:MAG: hypothetical protein M1831_001804 [Alyxoria varia]